MKIERFNSAKEILYHIERVKKMHDAIMIHIDTFNATESEKKEAKAIIREGFNTKIKTLETKFEKL